MSSEEEHEASEEATLRQDRASNRRTLTIVGFVTLTVIAWNLYAQFLAR